MKTDELRKKIDEIDRDLIALLERRMGIAREIAVYKRENGLPIYDEKREAEIYASRAAMVKDPANAEYAGSLVCNILASSKREQRRLMNVYLIGMPGAGKSTLARAAAQRTGLALFDTDEMAEKLAGRTVAELFCEGETRFREFERLALLDCARAGGGIVATGGGIVKNDANVSVMKGSGRTVFLDRTLDRLKAEDLTSRPLIKEPGDVERLYNERRESYLAAADIVIDPDSPGALDDLAAYCVE